MEFKVKVVFESAKHEHDPVEFLFTFIEDGPELF